MVQGLYANRQADYGKQAACGELGGFAGVEPGACAPKRDPQIPRELMEQEKSLAALQEHLNALVEKLRPLIVPPPSDGINKPAPCPEPQRCGIADKLHDHNMQISAIGNIIWALVENVEL